MNSKKEAYVPDNSKEIHKRFDHLIPFKNIVVPVEHRSQKNNEHSLRCFKKRFQKNEDGTKNFDLPKKRCKSPVVEGYLFCRRHGGQNYPVAVNKFDEELKPATSSTAKMYRGIYDAEMGNLMEVFLNDPQILDLKPELAQLRTIVMNYIKIATQPPEASNSARFLAIVKNTIEDDILTKGEKYKKILDLAESMTTLGSGKFIDRVNRCMDNIGKVIDRIHKYETKDDFMLTIDGVKLMLRAIVDLLDTNVKDEDIKNKIKESLTKLSIETKGNLALYKKSTFAQPVIDAKVMD